MSSESKIKLAADERVIGGAILSALVVWLLVRLELRAARGSELASTA